VSSEDDGASIGERGSPSGGGTPTDGSHSLADAMIAE
jgi:hypothetical protein